MNERFSAAVMGKCSCPPMIRSMSGKRSTRRRSSANVRCVIATITAGLSRSISGRYRAAVSIGSSSFVCFSLSPVISPVFRQSPRKATFSAVERPDDVRQGAADGLAGIRVDDVGDHPLPPGLAHPLNQDVVAEIELMIAERGQVEAGGVERGDHLLALERGGGDRRREEVAGQHEEGRAPLGGQALFHGRDAGEPAEAVDRNGGIDVVDLKQRERRPQPRRGRLVRCCAAATAGGDQERRDERESGQRAVSHVAT